jgi:hypothetical protein
VISSPSLDLCLPHRRPKKEGSTIYRAQRVFDRASCRGVTPHAIADLHRKTDKTDPRSRSGNSERKIKCCICGCFCRSPPARKVKRGGSYNRSPRSVDFAHAPPVTAACGETCRHCSTVPEGLHCSSWTF